jgi:hypothetical protein
MSGGQAAGGQRLEEGLGQLDRPVPADYEVLLTGAAFGADSTVADGDGAAHDGPYCSVMGDGDDGGAKVAVGQLEEVEYLGCGFMVELAGWFVGEEEARTVGEGDSDSEPLLFPA